MSSPIEINNIYLGDCLELIQGVPDHSVTAIITDPPYGMGNTSTGMKFSFLDNAQQKPFYKLLAKEFKRVLKEDTGSLYWFCDFRSYAFFYPIFDLELGVKNLLVWDKTNGPGSFYTYSHEFIILATQRKNMGKVGTNIIRYARRNEGRTIGTILHPCRKPLEVVKKFVRDSTQPGDLVLDCFLGSGTTCEAAKSLGRQFIGFEINEKNYEIAKRQVANCQPDNAQ